MSVYYISSMGSLLFSLLHHQAGTIFTDLILLSIPLPSTTHEQSWGSTNADLNSITWRQECSLTLYWYFSCATYLGSLNWGQGLLSTVRIGWRVFANYAGWCRGLFTKATQNTLKLSLLTPYQPSSWLRTFKEPLCPSYIMKNLLFTHIHVNETS